MSNSVPSTPSWMTEQRQRRQNRRGYGRRSSGAGGGARSTVKQPRRRGDAATLFGTASRSGCPMAALDFDEGEEVGDTSSMARGEGGRPPLPGNMGGEAPREGARRGWDPIARPPEGGGGPPAPGASSNGGLRLAGEFERTSRPRPKKTRPNLPRPPRAKKSARGAPEAAGSVLATPLNPSPFDFEAEEAHSGSARSGSTLSSSGSSTAEAGAPATPKTGRIPFRRAHSTTAAAAPGGGLRFEENVHPNDILDDGVACHDDRTGSAQGGVPGGALGTRRSSRLRTATMGRRNSVGGPAATHGRSIDNAMNGHGIDNVMKSPSVTARSRSRTNARKRSATAAGDAPPGGLACRPADDPNPDQKPSPPRMASFSSSSFSGSNSGGNHATGSSGSESFSSLARQGSSGATWGNRHKRSASVASFSNHGSGSGGSYKTPSACGSLRGRSISDGGDLSYSARRSSSTGNLAGPLGGAPPFPSPDKAGSYLSTPSIGERTSSSRKRRTMDPSPSLLDDGDGDGAHRARSRTVPPLPFGSIADALRERAPAALTKAATAPTGRFAPPATSSRGWDRNEDVRLGGNDDGGADETKEEVRDRRSSDIDESMMSVESDDDDDDGSTGSTTSEESEGADEDTPRELTDAEIFARKSSYEDFKFLVKDLQRWSRKAGGGGGASMGLHNGCIVVIPPRWTFERQARFAKWIAAAFGLRVSNVGGAGGGSFVRCSDAKGREVLDQLRRILNDYKAGKLAIPAVEEAGDAKEGSEKPPCPKLPLQLKSARRPSSTQKPTLSPFCDDFVGDLLADQMNGIALDEKKPAKSSPVPHFVRSMALPPLASKLKGTGLPRFRNRSPMGENGRRSSGGRGPRLSSEGALHGRDFVSHLHGGGSPSPLPSRLPGRLRERAGRALPPPGRPSFDALRASLGQGASKPFESPHPRNCALASPHPRHCSLALQTPCMETPMSKQAENWGSRPVLGKDWGESVRCCDKIIDACSQIFAKAWFTSDFYGNADLSAQFQMALDEGEEASLFAFCDADADPDSEDEEDEGNNSELASINGESEEEEDEFPTEVASKALGFRRCESVGASAFNLLHLDDTVKEELPSPSYGQSDRRRAMKLRKYARMSLCVAAAHDFRQPQLKRCYRLSESPAKVATLKGTPINEIVGSTAFSHVLSYLSEGELIHSASLVCARFADVSAEALGKLMLVSVGCDSSLKELASDDSSNEEVEPDMDARPESKELSTVAESMRRGWPYLTGRFPWANFLSEGAFKRVYKVWNNHVGTYEALSVMDVNAIGDSGNANLVGSELAVSVLLSSLARRNICPNFVVTRGVFTSQHEPPASLWGSSDDASPHGDAFDRCTTPVNCCAPEPNSGANYQYIRMELCQHGDVEEHIRNHPDKQLEPRDCRNLLFQMAFALHVAGDRFGLKHYDVKLLNFLLKSAKDPRFTDENHPHVVLRYGVGAHVFRLRMHPDSAHIAKLADYGTSVMRTDTDGQPVSLGQFTTLENTPPDFLIVGNTATQGYGHDAFGLGLCMFHLFTGHAPYEEILDEVVCPENLKEKLRKIWKQKSHDIIRSVLLYDDENGEEAEDDTLFDTLYRFLVLFGIPEKQFGSKSAKKVWRAISSTLLSSQRGLRSSRCPDADTFNEDREKFSLAEGTDVRIAGARRRLQAMPGAMELLQSLTSFDPEKRAKPLDVINSRFMADLREGDNVFYSEVDVVRSYTAYSATKPHFG